MTTTLTGDPALTKRIGKQLGASLRRSHFDEGRLRDRLGPPTSRTTPTSVSIALRRLGDDGLAAAARFWYLGVSLGAADAVALLEPLDLSELAAAGLIERQGDRVIAAIRIAPMGDLLIAHDFDRAGALAEDHVLGVGAATRTLAALTPRRQGARSLDLGTGNGAQALLAAEHSEAVVATDLSARAVSLAGLTAALNGRTNIEVRVGDAFDPVLDERFDLIVANPPFVISPDQALTFRDSSMGGEQLSGAIVRGAAAHLRLGGTAVVLVNWMVHASGSELAAPAAWVADLACDSLILHHDTLDPVSYAERWMLPQASAGPGSLGETLDRWLRYYARSDAVGIASGVVILRRTDGTARTRLVRMPQRPVDGGDHVERMLSAFGRFSGPEDPALPATRFRLVARHDLEQHLVFDDGGYQAEEAVLRLRRSAGVEASVPADLLEALFGIDGSRPLGDILDDVAAVRGASPETLRAHGLAAFLRLFERGYLATEES